MPVNIREQHNIIYHLLTKNKNIMTDTELKLKGNWNLIKGRLQKTFGALTDDDLIYKEGQEAELMGRIQKKTGKTKEEVSEFIQSI